MPLPQSHKGYPSPSSEPSFGLNSPLIGPGILSGVHIQTDHQYDLPLDNKRQQENPPRHHVSIILPFLHHPSIPPTFVFSSSCHWPYFLDLFFPLPDPALTYRYVCLFLFFDVFFLRFFLVYYWPKLIYRPFFSRPSFYMFFLSIFLMVVAILGGLGRPIFFFLSFGEFLRVVKTSRKLRSLLGGMEKVGSDRLMLAVGVVRYVLSSVFGLWGTLLKLKRRFSVFGSSKEFLKYSLEFLFCKEIIHS